MSALSCDAIGAARKRVESKAKIDRALIDDFLDSMSEILSAIGDEPNYAACLDQIDELASYVSSCYANGSYRKGDSERAFELGVIFGACGLFDSVECEEERRVADELRQSTALKYRKILEAVNEEPGITHGDLAEKCGKSKSMLSQIMMSIRGYRFFSVSALGKTKHYFLSLDAEKMLADMKGREAIACADANAQVEIDKGNYVLVPRSAVPARKISQIKQPGDGTSIGSCDCLAHAAHEVEEWSIRIGLLGSEVRYKRDSTSVAVRWASGELPVKYRPTIATVIPSGTLDCSKKVAAFSEASNAWEFASVCQKTPREDRASRLLAALVK